MEWSDLNNETDLFKDTVISYLRYNNILTECNYFNINYDPAYYYISVGGFKTITESGVLDNFEYKAIGGDDLWHFVKECEHNKLQNKIPNKEETTTIRKNKI